MRSDIRFAETIFIFTRRMKKVSDNKKANYEGNNKNHLFICDASFFIFSGILPADEFLLHKNTLANIDDTGDQ